MNKRIEWIDMIKFICILWVITAHLETMTTLLAAFFMRIVLIGFLFSSGYCYKNRNNFGAMLKKKVHQLFIPWFLWGSLSVCFHQLFSSWRKHGSDMSLGTEIKWFLLQVRGINDSIWFIAMMFVSFIPFYFLIKAYESSPHKARFKWYVLALYILGNVYDVYMPAFGYGTNALPWHIEYLPFSVSFMFLGYEYKHVYESRLKRHENLLFGISTAIYLSMSVIAYFFVFPAFFDLWYAMVHQLISIVFLVLLSKKLTPNRYTRFVGQNTLIYFPMHIYIYTLCQPVLWKVIPELYAGILNNVVLSSCFALALAFVISVILIIPAKIVNKYTPFLAGK